MYHPHMRSDAHIHSETIKAANRYNISLLHCEYVETLIMSYFNVRTARAQAFIMKVKKQVISFRMTYTIYIVYQPTRYY